MKQDITAEKSAIERIRRLAERDPLTNLFNRAQLVKGLSKLRQQARPVVLFLLDLDGFKQINDTYGHAAGDRCLKTMAARLRRATGG